MKIMLIEDQGYLRATVRNVLRPYGQVLPLSSYQSFLELSSQDLREIDLFIIDLDLEEELLGLKILDQLQNTMSYKVVLTGRDSQEVIHEVYKRGADDYLVKPFSVEDLNNIIQSLKAKKSHLAAFEKFNLNDECLTQLPAITESDLPVFLKGETGTGKTTIARAIHENSAHSKGSFVAFNCSEFAETLQESELFGHMKGSFTGAIKDKVGLVQQAHLGTLFLDEVATMPMSLQTKLLKVLEEKSFSPVGSEKTLTSEFRLISASCEDIDEKVKSGEFREDLYFRLQGLGLVLPNLRDQKKVLLKKIEEFRIAERRRRVIDDEAFSCLMNYSWPGNFRELQKELQVLVARKINIVRKEDLPSKMMAENQLSSDSTNVCLDDVRSFGLKNYLAKVEKEILQKVLEENRGKVRKTLSDLKISSHGFYRIRHGK